jgi:hypothetical protein
MDLLVGEAVEKRTELVREAWEHVSEKGIAKPTAGLIASQVWACLMELRIFEMATDDELALFPNGVRSYVDTIVANNIYG